MTDNLRSILTAVLAIAILAVFGCQPSSTNTNSGNTAVVNSTTANTANSTANVAVPATGTTTVSSSSTPTEVYKAAYKYRQNKDIEGLKKIFSKEVLAFLADIGKDDHKTVDDQLRELIDEPQYSTDEARNENITGEHATIEYRDTDGDWKTMDFVKEDGIWKMSLPGGGDSDDGKKRPKDR